MAKSLVLILATKQFASNPIMLGRLIHLLRQLKHQNPSTSDDFINSSEIISLVLILATKEALGPFGNDPIMSGRPICSDRHLECQNLSIISDSIGRNWILQKKLEVGGAGVAGGIS